MSSSSSDGSAFQVLRAVDGVRRSESTAGGSERFNSWLPGRDTAQHSPESYRVIGGMGVVVITEIDPRAFRAAGLNPAPPISRARPSSNRPGTNARGHAGGRKSHRRS